MPIYEYQCRDCGHQFDALQKMSDEPLRDCPECMEPALTKLVSAPSFRLSGSGWYETDFKADSDKKKNLVDSADTMPAKDKTAETRQDNTPDKTAGRDSKKEGSKAKTDKPKNAGKSNASSNAA